MHKSKQELRWIETSNWKAVFIIINQFICWIGSVNASGRVHCTLLILIFYSRYVLVGALLFRLWEPWDLLEGSYFCFISLSTIGFGDIVPGDKIYNHKSGNLSISFIATAIYLMLGMALIAMCFNLMQEEVIHKTRTCIKTCSNIFSCCTRQQQDS